jgi:hypothetical protein
MNLLNEKERRERDCKNMQNELNRISSMVHTYKNMAGGGELKMSQSNDQQPFGVPKKMPTNLNHDYEAMNNSNVSWLSGGQT